MPRCAWLLLLLLSPIGPAVAAGEPSIAEWVKLTEHTRDLEHLRQANAKVAGDVDALAGQLRDLQVKLAEAAKDAAALKGKVDWQDKRVADLSLGAGLLGALITLLALLAAFTGYFSVKNLAESKAEVWLKTKADELQAQIKSLEDRAATTAKKYDEMLRYFEKTQQEIKQEADKTTQKVVEHGLSAMRSMTAFKELTAEQREAIRQQATAARAKPETAYTAADWIARASKAIDEGKLEVARELLDDALAARGFADEDLARMMVMRGYVLGELEEGVKEIEAYDEVVRRFGERSEPALLEQVATALFNKGVVLGQLGQPQDAIAVYDEVERRFGTRSEPALLEPVAKALAYKGATLYQLLDRSQEAFAVYDEIERRFGDRGEKEVLAIVEQARGVRDALKAAGG